MSKVFFLITLLLFFFSAAGFASQISRISLSELHATADLVVMGEVTDVAEDGNRDGVTIQVDSWLKGSGNKKIYTFTLITRGGLKDFDPSLKKGDTGVFFLKIKGEKGHAEKAYWGSVAIFQKNHFYAADNESGASEPIDFNEFIDQWRSYRVKCNQIRNIDDYERGFRKGFSDPPGLVDGSADFNLGHSDGMMSKMKMFPGSPDGVDSK